MKWQTTEQMWSEFASAVMPADTPAVQRQEMKRAFMAGMFAMLTEVRKTGEEAVSEGAGVIRLETLFQELQAFQAQVKRRLA